MFPTGEDFYFTRDFNLLHCNLKCTCIILLKHCRMWLGLKTKFLPVSFQPFEAKHCRMWIGSLLVSFQMFEAIRNRHFTTVFDFLKTQATGLQAVSDVSSYIMCRSLMKVCRRSGIYLYENNCCHSYLSVIHTNHTASTFCKFAAGCTPFADCGL